MKWAAYLAGLAGAVLMVVLVLHSGYQRIFDAVGMAGWPLILILPYHLLPVALDAYGWRVLLAPADQRGRAGPLFLLWAALVREGVSRLLPVASVGGEVVGIRVTMLRGLSGAVVTASVIVEVLLSLVSQYAFTLIGVLLLLLLLHSSALVFDLLIGLGLTSPIPIVLLAVLGRTRPFERLRRGVENMLGGRNKLAAMFGRSGTLDDALHDLTRRHGRMAWATLWQFFGMFAGSFEVWLVLKLLGHSVSPAAAIALESITLAIRHLAFLIPAGLGAQEAGLVVFGQMLGLNSQTALALSLIKRGREIVFGLPILLTWQLYEARHLKHRRAAGAGSGPTSGS